MSKWFNKALNQGFIAVCALFGTSPLLFGCLLYGPIVVVGWLILGFVVFVIGGFIDWCSGGDEDPYYIHD